MKLFVVCFLFAVASASDVVELTDSDFKMRIRDFSTALVEFFAPWCGHCKRLAPEYEKAATQLRDSDITLVKVDCIANTEVCSKFGVSGYPTLKIFRGGENDADYNGPREADGIVKYMRKQVEPASLLLTGENYEKFLAREEPVVVGYFADAEDSDAKAFQSLTSSLRDDYVFGHTYDADILEKSGLQGHGLCGVMTSGNVGDFEKPVVTAFYNVDYVKNPKGTNYWRNRVMKVGKGLAEEFRFAIANVADFGQLLADVGMSGTGETPVVVLRDANDRKYVMEEEFNMDTFKAFLDKYKNDELKPKIKSEPTPDQDGPVTVVVGNNFDEIVMDESKDVLIEFYAPWCGHCKSLAPKWDELGEKMKENEDLVIAKIDATANDAPAQFAVSGFPTIYWAPKDNKKSPTKYNGGREVSDFVSFLEKNSSSKLKKTEL